MKGTQRQENIFTLVLEDNTGNNILGVFKVSIIAFQNNTKFKYRKQSC